MCVHLVSITLLLLSVGPCIAQSDEPCAPGPATTISDRDGVTAKALTFAGSSGKFSAYVFLPDTAKPVPGIAFSHSAIQYSDSRTNLLPFARALARAGAASIVLDGTVDWHTPNDDSKRPWRQVRCELQWLIANANLDLESLAIGGPIVLNADSYEPVCPATSGRPCYEPWIYVNFGWNSPVELRTTEWMKTPRGQLQMTPLVTGSFHLQDVQLSWLLDTVFAEPTSTQAAQHRNR